MFWITNCVVLLFNIVKNKVPVCLYMLVLFAYDIVPILNAIVIYSHSFAILFVLFPN
jgi:hypothetical protein